MKALRWHNTKDLRLENIEEPTANKGEVKLKIEWCGICGSDLHEYTAGPIFIPADQPHPLTGDKAPIIMGHEFSGQVVEIGEGVTKVQVGDRVTVEPIYNCGECEPCKQGLYNLCEKMGFYGLAGGGGGFSEFTSVPEHMLHKLPEGVSYEQGALVEPSAVALHAVKQSKLKVGDKAAVFGTGPIGLLVIEALKAAGASEIYAVELSEQRREKASEFGAIAIDPATSDAVEQIQKLTNGGVDVAFEVTGVPPVLKQAIHSTKFNGETMVVSIFEKEAPIHPQDLVLRERNLTGIIGYRDVFPAVINLMAQGYFAADKLVTKRIKLDEVIEEGFEGLLKERNHIKILVKAE
ncbi:MULTISPECIES: 2,3-butanediol dehydrogenase [unclassified Lysinibacillus]|uniref:2,3-butanediol dehydrogenase n=1 Tax=unclassified Lysinibacillus TaxID=2636778 RepID=UPI002013B8DE|nr:MULTISPECIES: 2,3-butanediol dehydrogenase [unclassified Lysinibacillus]MCL1696750.1 2,3-butanediol dehydrogenase [Lysinibacillus sp. BPa_S21]MCL1702658.1 2,3-butanediol dehydrogenase [Lysinibacillus sp. Bpr_S20]